MKFGGLGALSNEAAAAFESASLELDLSALNHLSDQAAKSLSQHEGKLWLNGLSEISEAAIVLLAGHRGLIEMNGLKKLSDDAAEALHDALNIESNYIHQSNSDASSAFIEPNPSRLGRNEQSEIKRLFKDRSLDSVQEACKRLVESNASDGDWVDCFSAGRLERLIKTGDAEIIATIIRGIADMPAAIDGFWCYFPRKGDFDHLINKLFYGGDPQVCSVLSNCAISYYWTGEMNDEVAQRLLDHKGRVDMGDHARLREGIQATEVQLALLRKLLRENRTSWSVDGAEFPVECAKVVAHCGDRLHFSELKTLTPEVANSLGNHYGAQLSFEVLTHLSDEAATGLSRHVGNLSFPALTDFSPKAARSLALNRGDIWFGAIETLTLQIAEGLAQSQHGLHFEKVSKLSVETAAALANAGGSLSFSWDFKELTREVAEALADHQSTIDLDHVESLSLEAAKAISQHRGTVRLTSAGAFSLEVATVLANSNGRMIVSLRDIADDFPEEVKAALRR